MRLTRWLLKPCLLILPIFAITAKISFHKTTKRLLLPPHSFKIQPSSSNLTSTQTGNSKVKLFNYLFLLQCRLISNLTWQQTLHLPVNSYTLVIICNHIRHTLSLYISFSTDKKNLIYWPSKLPRLGTISFILTILVNDSAVLL